MANLPAAGACYRRCSEEPRAVFLKARRAFYEHVFRVARELLQPRHEKCIEFSRTFLSLLALRGDALDEGAGGCPAGERGEVARLWAEVWRDGERAVGVAEGD